MKKRVAFEANVPVTATLAYEDGLKVQGRFGDQVMYSLTDGRVIRAAAGARQTGRTRHPAE